MFCIDIENKQIHSLNTNHHISFLLFHTDFYLHGDAELFMVAKSVSEYTNIKDFFHYCKNSQSGFTRIINDHGSANDDHLLSRNNNFGKGKFGGPLWLDWKKREVDWDKIQPKNLSLYSILDLFGKNFNVLKEKKEHAIAKFQEYLYEQDIWVENPVQLWFPLDEDIESPVSTFMLIDTGNEKVIIAKSLYYFYYFCFATS